MKSIVKLTLFLTIWLLSVCVYAEYGDYKYEFIGSNKTTVGMTNLDFGLEMEVWINDDNSIIASVSKNTSLTQQSQFNGGQMHLLIDQPEITLDNRLYIAEAKNSPDVSLNPWKTLDEIPAIWINDEIKVYARYEIESDKVFKYAYVGPITIKRTIVPKEGSLTITIKPLDFTEGKWKIKGTENWNDSGTTLFLLPGEYIVSFKDIEGYNTPVEERIKIIRGYNQKKQGNYISMTCALQPVISPESLTDVTLEIYQDATGWVSAINYEPYTPIKGLEPGYARIRFLPVSGWEANIKEKEVEIINGKTVTVEGVYCKLKLDPPKNVQVTTGKYVDKIVITWDSVVELDSPCYAEYDIYRNIKDDPDSATLIVTGTTETNYIDQSTSLKFNNQYYYWIKSRNKYGSSKEFSKTEFGFKKLKPVSVINVSDDNTDWISVSFEESEGATSYEIWRSDDTTIGNANRITHNYVSKSYKDKTPIPEKKYYYKLIAVNAYGSSDDSIYMFGKRELPPVKNVVVSFDDYCDKILVTWKCDEFSRDPIVIPHDVESKNLKINIIKSIVNEGCQYTDIAVTPGQKRYYDIITKNEYGTGKAFRTLNGRRAFCKPFIYDSSQGSLLYTNEIKWEKVDGADFYEIYRSKYIDFSISEKLPNNPVTTSYKDKSVYETYYYRIKAANNITFEGPYSNIVKAYPATCKYEIEPTTFHFSNQGVLGSFEIFVQDDPSCYWSLDWNVGMITDVNPLSGSGPRTVTFQVGQNYGTARSDKITMNGNRINEQDYSKIDIQIFQNNIFTLDINKIGNGIVKVDGKEYTEPIDYTGSKTVNIECIPYNKWSSDTNNPASLVMNTSKSITVKFNPDLNLSTNGQGTISKNSNNIELNSKITLTATPDEGWLFSGWSGDISGDTTPIEITMDQPKDIKANFIPNGWEADINFSDYYGNHSLATIGVKEIPEQEIESPYKSAIRIPKLPNWTEFYKKDVREQVSELQEFSWIIAVNPCQNCSFSGQNSATISWDPDENDNFKGFSPNGYYTLFDGLNSNGKVLINDMREITEWKIIGGNEYKYYTITWSMNKRPAMITLKGDSSATLNSCSVKINIDTEEYQEEAPPPATNYSCDLHLIPVPDWTKRLKVFIKKHNEIIDWVIAVDPKGNHSPTTGEGSSTLSWDLSAFGGLGHLCLIKGSDGNGEIIVHDMYATTKLDITGGHFNQYFTIRYTNIPYFDLNLASGWNLVSIPIYPDTPYIKQLIPDLKSAYLFGNGQYENATTIEPGKGYWFNVPEAKKYRIWGKEGSDYFSGYSNTLDPKWYLLGAINSPALPKSTPDKCINVIFIYRDGEYQITDKLLPGYGHWVRTVNTCDFILE